MTVLHPGAWAVAPTELGVVGIEASERHLVERALGGERPALREIYELHAPRIQRFLRDLLGDRAAAADGTQETFARAFRRLHTLREGDRLTPWLFGIARNVCLELRKSRRRDRVPAPPRTDRDEADARTPEQVLLGREAARLVDRALSRLSEDRRTALLLRADHGLAYDEIARLMRWSLSKAKVEIHRARLELRAELAARGGER